MPLSKRKAAAAILLMLLADDEPKTKRQRTCWVRSWIRRRESLGVHNGLLEELRLEDPNAYRRYLRMDEDTFVMLLNIVTPKIQKKDTNFRPSISPSEMLSCTLRHLATGESQWSLSTQFRIGQSTISSFLVNVCDAIYEGLKDYIKVPSTKDEWRAIADSFYNKWNYPFCLGALDGKHVEIEKPTGSGSEYFNYKKYCSVVLLALVDADLKFIYVDVGSSGKCCDSGIWGRCSLNQAIMEGTISLPEDGQIGDYKLPYVFIGDEGFALSNRMMIPYSNNELDHDKRIHNYRLSRARRISENGFGVLAKTYGILQKPIAMDPQKVDKVILCICALQNLLRSRKATQGIVSQPGLVDSENTETGEIIPGLWRQTSNCFRPLSPSPGNNTPSTAKQIRDRFKEYFNGSGKVPWQERMISYKK